RGEDVILLFRKFASDFAEKYHMPAVQLSEEAKEILISYRWPGNVRQLKNVTEQISIIETNREITRDILANYLPVQAEERFPALIGGIRGAKGFESEREILYQVLFDMRQDVTELKKLVHDIMTEKVSSGGAYSKTTPQSQASTAINTRAVTSAHEDDDIQDAEEYVEETLALKDMEKEMIRKALDKHRGKRKY
ncbi:Nitric oxide reductase transcription regulator NorR2, partial [termite gut metagenome]